MVTRQQVQGDYSNLIQSPEISSSSDLYLLVTRCALFPACRMSYRKRLRYLDSINNHIPAQTLVYAPNILTQYVKLIHNEHNSTRKSIITLGAIFISTLVCLWWIYNGFPELQEEEKVHMKIPWNLDDAKNLGTVLYRYKGDHFYHVYFGVCLLYIFLQTFAIPGSLFLSVLSGFLFSFPQAMLLVSSCSAIGASLCFLISHLLGRRIIYKYFPEKAEQWATAVNKHRENLLNYVIFLRVTPFLPNWFINLTAPVIGVPLYPFAFGTLLGVMPPSFVALQAGQTLHSMSAEDAKVSWTSMSLLIIFGFVALLPIYFKDRLKKKFE